MPDTLHYEFGNGTDVGCVRSQNEDSFALFQASDRRQMQQRGHLVLVCDGMGGARGGREASSIAIEEIAEVYYGSNTDDPRTAITQAVKSANSRIYERAQEEQALKGMGTTTVTAILLENLAYIAHIGDSRCYLIRNKEIRQITEDHTVVQKMVKQGLITTEQARTHPESHILSRSVGVSPDVELDLTMDPLELQGGDILVLCSDGLSGQVMDDEILQIAVGNSAQRAVEKMINLAKERGGPDNITVQIVRVHSHETNNEIGTTTVRTAPLPHRSNTFVIILLILIVALAAVGLLWLVGMLDIPSLLGLE
jgi:PPM family protein phosphatase